MFKENQSPAVVTPYSPGADLDLRMVVNDGDSVTLVHCDQLDDGTDVRVLIDDVESLKNGSYQGRVRGFEPIAHISNATTFGTLSIDDIVVFEYTHICGISRHNP